MFFGGPYRGSRCTRLYPAAGSPEVVRSSDPMDVELLSTAIPVSHFVLADRAMEVRVKKLKIDEEWATKVFSMATIDELFALLRGL